MNNKINATPRDEAGIKKALDAYIEAALKGDSNIAKPVFGEMATISYSDNDSLVSNPIQALYDYYDQTGPHHAEYEISSLEVAGNVAIVRIDSKFGDVTFDDMFALVKDGNDWKIVSKVYNVK
ncbi:MAG: nuclear transport factor 2 family protein [Muribaculaceae bacterium]|nr:nuclear transport factor 2 family protein [Muribaculaceae bacterium]